MINLLAQYSPHHPPRDASILESILWILTNPGSWWPLIQMYAVEIIIFTIIISIVYYILTKLTKYYILKEVYTVDPKDLRNSQKIGRQIFYGERGTKNPFLRNKFPDDERAKAIIIVKDGWKSPAKKIVIPKNVKVLSSHPKKTAIMRANLKFDYNRFKALIPTNETFEAISPSPAVYQTEIDNKIVETDTHVSKSINCNPDVAKYQRTSGSIPLSVTNKRTREKQSKLIGDMPSYSHKDDENKSSKKENKTKRVLSKADGLSDLYSKMSGDS